MILRKNTFGKYFVIFIHGMSMNVYHFSLHMELLASIIKFNDSNYLLGISRRGPGTILSASLLLTMLFNNCPLKCINVWPISQIRKLS